MCDSTTSHPRAPEPPTNSNRTLQDLEQLSWLLAHGRDRIMSVLGAVRESRRAVESSAVHKIRHTHDKLREVSSTTEVAATDILNGLERASSLVDELDQHAATSGDTDARAAEVRTALRDELFALMGAMQFQDITSQQLAHASTVLGEAEARLTDIATIFDPASLAKGAVQPRDLPATYDAKASMFGRAERQAVADSVLAQGLVSTTAES